MNRLDTVWHDMTFRNWHKLWDEENWREWVSDTLYEIACSSRAAVQDRLLALQSINEAIMQKVIVDPDFPVLMRDVLLNATVASKAPRWFGKRARKRLHERLLAARWMLNTAYQFGALELDEQPKIVVEDGTVGAHQTKPGAQPS